MKNKKSIMALICIICGLILGLYCLLAQLSPIITISTGVVFNTRISNSLLFVACALFFILAGVFSIATRLKALRISSYAFLLVFAIISVILAESPFVSYPTAVVALIALLVEVLDKEPNKKLYFVMEGKDIQAVFAESKPEYKRPEPKEPKEPKIKEPKAKKADSSKFQSAKIATRKAKRKRVPHAGKLAKAPGGKSFKYKKKRK